MSTTAGPLRDTLGSYADTVEGAVSLLAALSQGPDVITRLLRGIDTWAGSWAPALADGMPDVRLASLSVRNPADLTLVMAAGGNPADIVRLLNEAVRPGFANPPTYQGCPAQALRVQQAPGRGEHAMSSGRPVHPARLLASVAAFVALALLLTVFVVISVLDLGRRNGTEYHALVADAAGLRAGDDVNIAGPEVGKVTAVDLRDDDVRVTFVVSGDHRLDTDTRTAVRYANLIGTRYLALLPPASGTSGARLDPGGTLPSRQSLPTVDLTAVFDGFQPLFDALDPAQVNEPDLVDHRDLPG
ncbi:MCE family protein [Nocardioides sp. W3-2-3]|uniref:MlaD family protein n=1 Tax=Nocardioides convexus TaxID=2712224 RepID=UPI0024182B96|nr:MlaD family protein [Nocardioides convexus]NHA00073.1 MCE family protein [Nocardioides convexus]